VIFKELLQASHSQLFEKLLDGGDASIEKMYKSRGDTKINSTLWTDSEETFEGIRVLKQKIFTTNVKVNEFPFVSSVPTT